MQKAPVPWIWEIGLSRLIYSRCMSARMGIRRRGTAAITQVISVLPAAGFAFAFTHHASWPTMPHAPHPAWSHPGPHTFAVPHHSVAMVSGKTALILDDRPDLFVAELIAEPDHRGAGRTMLDHPEDLTFRPMAPEIGRAHV